MKKNLKGMKFGRLTVIKRHGTKNKCATWLCKCECGNEKIVLGHHLYGKKDTIKSCGCLKNELKQNDYITCNTCYTKKSKTEYYKKDRCVNTRSSTCKECAKKLAQERYKENYRKLRREVLTQYSKNDVPECQCCGEKHIEFLTIDHIDGGGNQHRKSLKKELGLKKPGSNWFYRWLRNNSYPTGYRTLCWNCNVARGLYGYCPHEKEKT